MVNFGMALEDMKRGLKLARAGWNGRGIFVSMKKGFDLEAAAEKSHIAWMEQKQAQGVTSRKAEDGEELIVPYSELSEAQKDMDRKYAAAGGEMTGDFLFIDTTGLKTDNPDAPKCLVPWFPSQTDMLAEDWGVIL